MLTEINTTQPCSKCASFEMGICRAMEKTIDENLIQPCWRPSFMFSTEESLNLDEIQKEELVNSLKEREKEEAHAVKIIVRVIVFSVMALVLLICLGMYGCPKYKIWVQTQESKAALARVEFSILQQATEGRAELAKAEFNRQIVVQEAKAKEESAKLLAQAEVERAKGVAQANLIIGNSLKGNDEYLRYLWIHNMGESKDQIIYIPTEAGLPILEAGRRRK